MKSSKYGFMTRRSTYYEWRCGFIHCSMLLWEKSYCDEISGIKEILIINRRFYDLVFSRVVNIALIKIKSPIKESMSQEEFNLYTWKFIITTTPFICAEPTLLSILPISFTKTFSHKKTFLSYLFLHLNNILQLALSSGR